MAKQARPTVIELPPESIHIDERIDVRPFTKPNDPDELRKVEQLAGSIEREGQLHPVTVRAASIAKNGKEEVVYGLIAGRRRLLAIQALNAGKTKGQEPVEVQCLVEWDVSDERAEQQALMENLHRKDFSPMDLAANIARIKARLGASKNGKWADRVAEYLQVSPAQVTQHYKLLDLPDDIQQRVHKRELSAQAAFDLVDVEPGKRQGVLDIAKRSQIVEERGQDESEAVIDLDEEPGTPIKRRHIVQAARDTDALQKPKARTRSDILDLFESLNGLAYGFENGAVRQFLSYFVQVWATGKGTDRTLIAYFDKMVDRADQGTEPKPVTKGKTKAPQRKSVKPKK